MLTRACVVLLHQLWLLSHGLGGLELDLAGGHELPGVRAANPGPHHVINGPLLGRGLVTHLRMLRDPVLEEGSVTHLQLKKSEFILNLNLSWTLQGTSGPVSACSWGAAPMLAWSVPEPDVETSSAITGVPPITTLGMRAIILRLWL